jgi:hypothetical protein
MLVRSLGGQNPGRIRKLAYRARTLGELGNDRFWHLLPVARSAHASFAPETDSRSAPHVTRIGQQSSALVISSATMSPKGFGGKE